MIRISSGYGFAVLAAFCWSLMTLFSKILFAAGLSPLEISFWRASIGCICFGIHASYSYSLKIKPSRALLFMLWGMLSIGGLFYVFFMSMQYNGAAMGEILLYTAPVWVAVFSRFISREVVSRRRWLAIVVALVGVTFVCFSGGSLQTETSATGVSCGLASGLIYAMQYPFFKYWQKQYSTEVLYTYLQLGGSLVLLPFIHFNVPYSTQTWSVVVMTALFTGYMAFWAYGQSLKRIPQVHVAVFCNLEPILGTVWVCCFFGENFTLAGWAGFSLIILAVFMLSLELKGTNDS
ncbi:DMT family transporter [Desulfovibrio ferrophilus]|uniref:DMT family transporter n=1 Tax=Desulfovibrio ferrophilus TaxID=241368 RepID=UPI000F8283B6|nr:DMT family transporter [Desulfovibrio ferrophilus]